MAVRAGIAHLLARARWFGIAAFSPLPLAYHRLRRVILRTLRPMDLSRRPDRTMIPVQDGVSLELYWKTVDGASCPSLALDVLGSSVLRFDCHGRRGHYHVHLDYPPAGREGRRDRLLLSETTVEEQIERSVFELGHNAQYVVRRSPHPAIRKVKLDGPWLNHALDCARDLIAHHDKGTESAELRRVLAAE